METRNIFHEFSGRGVIGTGLWALVTLAFIGCAQFAHTDFYMLLSNNI